MTVRARLALLVATVAVVWPAASAELLDRPARDSFPLSTYPMFTQPRDRVTDIASVVGVDDTGARVLLSPREIGGTDEPIQAVGTVNRAVRRGRAAADALCRTVATRVAERRPDVVAVAVVTDTVDTIAWWDGQVEPSTTVVHAECSVLAAHDDRGDER